MTKHDDKTTFACTRKSQPRCLYGFMVSDVATRSASPLTSEEIIPLMDPSGISEPQLRSSRRYRDAVKFISTLSMPCFLNLFFYCSFSSRFIDQGFHPGRCCGYNATIPLILHLSNLSHDHDHGLKTKYISQYTTTPLILHLFNLSHDNDHGLKLNINLNTQRTHHIPVDVASIECNHHRKVTSLEKDFILQMFSSHTLQCLVAA